MSNIQYRMFNDEVNYAYGGETLSKCPMFNIKCSMSNPPSAEKNLFEKGGDGLSGNAVRFEDLFHFGRIRGAGNGFVPGDEAI